MYFFHLIHEFTILIPQSSDLTVENNIQLIQHTKYIHVLSIIYRYRRSFQSYTIAQQNKPPLLDYEITSIYNLEHTQQSSTIKQLISAFLKLSTILIDPRPALITIKTNDDSRPNLMIRAHMLNGHTS